MAFKKRKLNRTKLGRKPVTPKQSWIPVDKVIFTGKKTSTRLQYPCLSEG